jgi:hypothetical protein
MEPHRKGEEPVEGNHRVINYNSEEWRVISSWTIGHTTKGADKNQGEYCSEDEDIYALPDFQELADISEADEAAQASQCDSENENEDNTRTWGEYNDIEVESSPGAFCQQSNYANALHSQAKPRPFQDTSIVEGQERDYAHLQTHDEPSATFAPATSASSSHSQAKPRPFQDTSIVEGQECDYAQLKAQRRLRTCDVCQRTTV